MCYGRYAKQHAPEDLYNDKTTVSDSDKRPFLDMPAAGRRLGPARPDIARAVRLFPVKRHVVLYRERPDGIEVVRVVQEMRRMVGTLDAG